ncbi:alpha/beta hydrolase-fold protein [Aquimarina sp. LLG6339-5]|uniref:alpha/beta hydrolase-fold protein n=1 Tax=Aquimarina sp. LLG6339-5 TaxID=3160830 RepID=UPI0038709C0B
MSAQDRSSNEITIHSKVLKKSRKIKVFDPNKDVKKPIVVVLDAQEDIFYELIKSNLVYGNSFDDELPQSLLVGIVTENRRKDYTNESFRRFILEELIPYLVTNYNTAGYKVMISFSLSGSFHLQSLRDPTFNFDGNIIFSPAVSDQLINSYIDQGLPNHINNKHIYISSGTIGQNDAYISKQLLKLKQHLGDLTHLNIDIVKGINHNKTPNFTIAKGLYHVFYPWIKSDMLRMQSQQILKTLAHKYKLISEIYGEKKKIQPEEYNFIAELSLKNDNAIEALEIVYKGLVQKKEHKLLFTKTKAHYHLQQIDIAITSCKEALDILPESDIEYEYLSKIYRSYLYFLESTKACYDGNMDLVHKKRRLAIAKIEELKTQLQSLLNLYHTECNPDKG